MVYAMKMMQLLWKMRREMKMWFVCYPFFFPGSVSVIFNFSLIFRSGFGIWKKRRRSGHITFWMAMTSGSKVVMKLLKSDQMFHVKNFNGSFFVFFFIFVFVFFEHFSESFSITLKNRFIALHKPIENASLCFF